MEISKDIKYIGVNDHKIDLFEGQYKVPNGMTYNSYLILDEKTAVLDTVEKNFTNEWLANIENCLNGKTPDYLIIQHMEPDHSSSITAFLEKYKSTTIVSSNKSFVLMKNFYNVDCEGKKIEVNDNSTLVLGKHILTFLTAPMVHWPEVIITYDSYEKTLFSADAFGKFGASDISENWLDEARRYYFGIVGKYGMQVNALLNKTENLEIKTICSLHGNILKENIPYYINFYKTWANYQHEEEGVFIAYTSVYGNTRKAVKLCEDIILSKGLKVVVQDLARTDMSLAVANAFKYGKIILATTTYNNEIYPFMHTFVNELVERFYQNKKIGLIENGSWMPQPIKIIKSKFEKCKNITFTNNCVSILSGIKEKNIEEIKKMIEELISN